MAIRVNIEEFESPYYKRGSPIAIPFCPGLANQAASSITTTTQFTLSNSTRFVVISAIGGAGYAVFGANPSVAAQTGATGAHFIPSGGMRAFFVKPGSKVAVSDGS